MIDLIQVHCGTMVSASFQTSFIALPIFWVTCDMIAKLEAVDREDDLLLTLTKMSEACEGKLVIDL